MTLPDTFQDDEQMPAAAAADNATRRQFRYLAARRPLMLSIFLRA